MGCDKVRVFTGSRVADPATVYQRVADIIGEMSKTAEREKVYLLIENEGSQNVGPLAGAGRHHEADSFEVGGNELGPAQRLRQGDQLPEWLRRAAQEAHPEHSGQGQGRDAVRVPKRKTGRPS